MAVSTRILLLSLASKGIHKALLTSLLSTTAVAAAHTSKSLENSGIGLPSPGAACCYPTSSYSSLSSHWTRQTCLASDLLDLHHTAKFTGRSVPSRSLSSGYSSDEEEECLQWHDIDTEEFVQLVAGEEMQLFDVREPEELEETGIVPGAVNLPRKLVCFESCVLISFACTFSW